jgi:hypothetical protein
VRVAAARRRYARAELDKVHHERRGAIGPGRLRLQAHAAVGQLRQRALSPARPRHVGAESKHVGSVFQLDGEPFEVEAIHAHPAPHVDLAVLRIARKMPHVFGVGLEPRPGELVVGGGTGVTATEQGHGEYAWSGERTASAVGWEYGDRREVWARGAVHHVDEYAISVEFSSQSFAGTMSDSGAPILRKHNDGYEVLGVACGISGQKGLTRYGDKTMYVRLDHHVDWINQYR